MPENHGCPNLFLPDHWSRHVKAALLHSERFALNPAGEIGVGDGL